MKKYELTAEQQKTIEKAFQSIPDRDGWAEKFEMVNEKTAALSRLMFSITPPGPEQTMALRKLQEAQHWFVDAIKKHEL